MPGTGPLTKPWPITVLAIVDFLGALFALPLGIFGFISDQGKDQVGVVIGLLLAVLGAASLLAGIGMWTLKPYGRSTQIALACVGLLAFPLGTIISVLILVYLFRPGAKVLFSGRLHEQLTPAETAAVAQLATGGATIAVVAVAIVFLGIAFMGIISAIAIPNLITAIQRGKQKRTMGDMRTIAAALEEYGADYGSYPNVSSLAELAPVIQAKSAPNVALVDGWQHDFRILVWQENANSPGPDSHVLASAGRDGTFEQNDPRAYEHGACVDFNADIVLLNGEFIRSPAAVHP